MSGALALLALVGAGLAAALLIDRLGAFGLPVKEVTWLRLLSVALVLAGLLLFLL